jgi:ribosome-binding protein aMBF1 (putative translation factor)
LAKQPPKKPRKTAKAKKVTNKPFGARFPERQSVAARNLATNVKRLREMHCLSQQDLAKVLKTEQAAISLIETARANPTLLMIEQIAAALRVTAGELLTSQK